MGSRQVGVALLLLMAGCGDEARDSAPEPLPPAPAPGIYSGVFPCDGCPGIDVDLWLRADGRFLLEQRYRPADDGVALPPAHALGHWEWVAAEAVLNLAGAGPLRVFEQPVRQALVMRTASPQEHRLDLDASRAVLDATLLLRGSIRRDGDGFRFHECLTGLEAPLATGGDFRRFRNLYRSVAPGSVAPVEFDGRFTWAPDGSPTAMSIEKFITLRVGSGC